MIEAAKASVPEVMDAEQALLGRLLAQNETIAEIPQQFRPEHFYAEVHRNIYIAIREEFDGGRQANPITLRNRFDKDALLSGLGGGSYLARLLPAGSCVDVASYCGLIQATWLKRELLRIFQRAVNSLCEGSDSPGEVAAIVNKESVEVLAAVSRRAMVTDFDVGERVLEGLKNPARCVSTGMPRLDQAMGGGIFSKKLYGFAARKKYGKTVLASTLSHNLSEQGVKHLFICAEMSSEEVLQRILARRTESFESAFRSDYGKSAAFQDKLAQAVITSKRCIYFEDKPGISFTELQQVIAMHVMRNNIKGFILDYWQLVGGKPSAKSNAEHLDDVAQWLATACRKFNVWGVMMAQINQEGNTRGSEGIRLACDQLYEIRRDDVSIPTAWLEMMETRYTKWTSVGGAGIPGMSMNEKGPFFEESA